MVVLGARNEMRLWRLFDLLRNERIPFVPIDEPDPPYNGSLMAIGVEPGDRDVLWPHFRDFQIIREDDLVGALLERAARVTNPSS